PSNGKVCVIDGTDITVNFGIVAAHRQVTIAVALKMPSVDELTTVKVDARANGDQAVDAGASQQTTVLPDRATVVFQPSDREDVVTCGDTLTSDFYGDDDTAQLKDHGLGCASYQIGLRMAASGKTFSLNGNKIIGGALSSNKGNIGVVIAEGTT